MSRIKLYKPTTPSRRHTSIVDYASSLTKDVKPTKALLLRKKNRAGRNSTGKITVRHRGGGYRSLVRMVNFNRTFPLGFKVVSTEYDPGRTAFVCLVTDLETGKKHYVLHTNGMKDGEKYGANNEISAANGVVLALVPVGTEVSQLEINPGQGAKLVRGAGTYATVSARENGFVTVKLPSGEIRKLDEKCTCVINPVGNGAHNRVRTGKAGINRHKGFRPTVRGKVMNPVDHPHGGGEARNSIGLKYPKTPWGKHALGVATRRPKKQSAKFIVSRRNGKKAK